METSNLKSRTKKRTRAKPANIEDVGYYYIVVGESKHALALVIMHEPPL